MTHEQEERVRKWLALKVHQTTCLVVGRPDGNGGYITTYKSHVPGEAGQKCAYAIELVIEFLPDAMMVLGAPEGV
jgi:hypothetical protein